MIIIKRLFLVTIFASLFLSSGRLEGGATDYSGEMRKFVIRISVYAKKLKPGFIIIPQNGIALVTENKESNGRPALDYLAAIDGVGQEELFYGYKDDDEPTPVNDRKYLAGFVNAVKSRGKQVLVTDYCHTHLKIDDSYARNAEMGNISFAAQRRELDIIATYPVKPFNKNRRNITSLVYAKNFLYMINPGKYSRKSDYLKDISNTDYDVVLIDLFFKGSALTRRDVSMLKTKKNGGSRFVIAYMSIGEAEDYRYYWNSSWNSSPPSWVEEENPDWPGNYKVKYWSSEWQSIIFGNNSSYLKKIINAGFDGAYLDIIDAYEYFEE